MHTQRTASKLDETVLGTQHNAVTWLSVDVKLFGVLQKLSRHYVTHPQTQSLATPANASRAERVLYHTLVRHIKESNSGGGFCTSCGGRVVQCIAVSAGTWSPGTPKVDREKAGRTAV